MTAPVFPQTVIAVIWDFDKTLIPGYMQQPLFDQYAVDAPTFWAEVNALPDFQRRHGLELVSPDTAYLNHILTYVRSGIFEGLNNEGLRLGQEQRFYEGLPGFFPRLKGTIAQSTRFARFGISVEHYVVSTGLRQIIMGSAIAEHVDGVFACEFVEHVAPPGFLREPEQATLDQEVQLRDIGYVIDNTTKTRAVFEINKGVNKHPEQIDVNSRLAPEDRRIPIENMVYIADGPSDVPVFSILNQYGGKTYAVYKPRSRADFLQVRALLEQDRVHAIGEADYREGTQTEMWISSSVEQIAERIVRRREETLGERAGKPPRHLVEPTPPLVPELRGDPAAEQTDD